MSDGSHQLHPVAAVPSNHFQQSVVPSPALNGVAPFPNSFVPDSIPSTSTSAIAGQSPVFLSSTPGNASAQVQTNQMIQTVTQQIQQLQQIIQQLQGNRQQQNTAGVGITSDYQLQQLTQQLQPLLQQLQSLQLQQQQQQQQSLSSQTRFPATVYQGLPPPSVPFPAPPPGVVAQNAYSAPLTQPIPATMNQQGAAIHHMLLPATENFQQAAKECSLIAKDPTYSTGTRVGAALDSVIYRMRAVEERRKHKPAK